MYELFLSRIFIGMSAVSSSPFSNIVIVARFLQFFLSKRRRGVASD